MDSPADRDEVRALEERVAALERTVAALTGVKAAPPVPPAQLPASPREAPALAAPQPSTASAAAPKPVQAARLVQEPLAPHLGPTREPAFDIEQWLGARGLLLVGVVALLTAAGFFLKYAFDRGWVAPEIRVLGAVAAGIALAVYGERQVRAGMRRFGLALVGAGGGLVYLGIWAAAGPYALVSRSAGIAAIVATAVAAAWRAVRHDAEALALWALLGAFIAPVLLRGPEPDAQMFLGYTAVVSFATAAVARAKTWRLALTAALAGGLALVVALVPEVLHAPLGFVYLAVLGLAAVYVPARAWIELRLVLPLVVWLAFIAAAAQVRPGPSWFAEVGAVSLLIAGWWQHRQLAVLRAPRLSVPSPADDANIEFVFSPIACAIVVTLAGGTYLRQNAWLPLAALAALYLATGWRGRWAAFVALGWTLAGLALVFAFSDADVILAFSAAIVAGAAADRWQDQAGMAPVTLALVLFGGVGSIAGMLGWRSGEAAFVGPWSMAFYSYVVATALAAWWWRTGPDRAGWAPRARAAVWVALGSVVFGGVSLELDRLFRLMRDQWPSAGLAGDLATSVWWLLYAGLLVRIGFTGDVRQVRWAGLGVAGLAALKITFVDLSTLEALYRVAAFFVLALIALAVAYAYNRRARGEAAQGPPAP